MEQDALAGQSSAVLDHSVAVCVHSYCLKKYPMRAERPELTSMAETAMRTGVRIVNQLHAANILVSTAYDTWRDEAHLQREIANGAGILGDRIHIISDIENSYHESKKFVARARELGAKHLFVIAEEWHAPRSRIAFNWAAPKMPLDVITFKTPHYDAALEPAQWKVWRSQHKWLWVPYNIAMCAVKPEWVGMHLDPE